MKNDTTAILGALCALEQIVEKNADWLKEHGASPQELLTHLHESRGELLGALNAASASLSNAERTVNGVAGILSRFPEGPFAALLRFLKSGSISARGLRDFPEKPSSLTSGPRGLMGLPPVGKSRQTKSAPAK